MKAGQITRKDGNQGTIGVNLPGWSHNNLDHLPRLVRLCVIEWMREFPLSPGITAIGSVLGPDPASRAVNRLDSDSCYSRTGAWRLCPAASLKAWIISKPARFAESLKERGVILSPVDYLDTL